ncbi:MAG: polysaccharide deacetylase family protein [bacterium]
MRKVCSISIDVDSLDCYYQIHGIAGKKGDNIVYERAIPRFLDLLDRLGVKATFFVIGKDVQEGDNHEIIREIIQAGHKIGNHTWSHQYGLTRLSSAAIREEIEQAHLVLKEVTGTPISGFRAPGYNINSDIVVSLKGLGYIYDSSIFPSPPYYLAKLAAIILKRIRGRKSHSVMGHPAILLAPSVPYVPSVTAPWHKGASGLVELPITVLPIIGLPFIGTYITMAGRKATRFTYKVINRLKDFLNLEFHAIDLLDIEGDKIDPLLSCQVDLKVSYQDKISLFEELFSLIKEDYEVLTLEQAAERVSSQLEK